MTGAVGAVGSARVVLTSCVCQFAAFTLPWYREAESKLRLRELYAGHSAEAHDFVNRKFWEWCAITRALDERSALAPGRRGLGFAVGTEPLSSYFAARGCDVLATDLDVASADQGWVKTGQHAAHLAAIHKPALVSLEDFSSRVSFRPADMRSLGDLPGGFDFMWSSCALEHLGTLDAGIDFILNAARLLKPGGVAVHTTEFNVVSDTHTIEAGPNVIYRRRDIERLSQLCHEAGLHLEAPDFDVGNHAFDKEFDVQPYMSSDRRHIKLLLDEHVCTSMMLIVHRGPWPTAR